MAIIVRVTVHSSQTHEHSRLVDLLCGFVTRVLSHIVLYFIVLLCVVFHCYVFYCIFSSVVMPTCLSDVAGRVL